MSIKLSAFLTAGVFAAGFLVTVPNAGAQPYPMPTGTTGVTDKNNKQPWDPKPGPGTLTGKVLTYGVDGSGNTVPVKTLTIVNNSDKTVYPIMRDPNSKLVDKVTKQGLYDPYDATDKEYRGYIGYVASGTYYFGLRPNETAVVPLPLVFWNGARIGIGTDGEYLTAVDPNPLRYRAESVRSIAPALSKDHVVMWYRAPIAEAPNDDTEDQLAEWTIRDHVYMIKMSTKDKIPDTELVTLINYDISNVDNLYLPLAMQVTDAWVLPQVTGTGKDPNRNGRWKAGSMPEPNGWTGSVGDIASLQDKIKKFTEGSKEKPNTLLGKYFDGRGWPYYNMPNAKNDPNMPIKIPSGANVFAQSPIKGTPTSYITGTNWASAKYMLSSGGTNAISVPIGNSITVNPKGSTTLNLNNVEPQAKMDFIKEGFLVTGLPAPEKPKPNPIQDNTTVKSVDPKAWTVVLSNPLANTSDKTTYAFSRPVDDYAAGAMIKLWYGWAQYYLDHWKDKNPQAPTAPVNVKASMEVRSATITFSGSQQLVPGMAVKGPSLDDAMTEDGPHQGLAVILKAAADGKSAVLSQVARNPSTNGDFTLMPPSNSYNPLLWTPKAGQPGYPPLKLDKFATNEPWHDPYEFSQAVYLIMASMNQIGKPNNDSQCKFMQDIIGANMGYIFDQPAKDADDGQMVIAMIRDLIKSVLRGVTDFTKYPDVIKDGKHIYWYPEPSEKTANQEFNVFNLDPFVWFVHVELGFSGYGFSVDDDTADIGAGGANNLILTITGTKGLKNLNVWTIQAPYGPVTAEVKFSGTATDTLYNSMTNVSATSPIKITTEKAHHLTDGMQLIIDQVKGVPEANGKFMIRNVTKETFSLYDFETGKTPVAGTGKYVAPSGRWGYMPVPYVETGKDLSTVFYRVIGDDAMGTFQGTPVTVVKKGDTPIPIKGPKGEKIRVWRLGKQDTGQLLLNTMVIKDDGSNAPLEAGTYKFTFSGT